MRNIFLLTLKVIIVVVFAYGCNSRNNSTLNEFTQLKISAKKNYLKNKDLFADLKQCFRLKFIKVIEFRDSQNVAIEYKMNDTAKWQKTEFNLKDLKLQSPLIEENISSDYLLDLWRKLDQIHAKRIWIIDDYDVAHDFNFKKLEIKYLHEVNGLFFFYEIFDRPLQSIESSHYALQTKKDIGEVLDYNVIMFYK